MDIMRSVVGMVVLLAIAFLLSVNKKSISLRTVGAALLLQIAIGGIMLYFPPGKWAVEQAALGVHKVMSYSDAGSAFIFGSLVGPKMDVLFDGAGFIFAFRVLPAIIFVTALISLLYYIGVILTSAKSNLLSQSQLFSSGKMRSRRSLNRLSIA